MTADRPVAVIEGDQETLLDAERIRAAGARAVQVNTGAGCHLDADMVHRALRRARPGAGSLLFIENVGNLVCPALFDLGEQQQGGGHLGDRGRRTSRSSIRTCSPPPELVIINKIDLLPYVDFDLERCAGYARSVNPGVKMLPLSATTGDGCGGMVRVDRLAAHASANCRMSDEIR